MKEVIFGSGVIWNVEIPFAALVIPAKAGIQSVGGAFPMACAVDSRLRGNDGTAERLCLANDTTTPKRHCLKSSLAPSIIQLDVRPMSHVSD